MKRHNRYFVKTLRFKIAGKCYLKYQVRKHRKWWFSELICSYGTGYSVLDKINAIKKVNKLNSNNENRKDKKSISDKGNNG